MKKLPFSQQITFFVLEIDPQNIFHYQCDIKNYKDEVLNFHYIVDINLYKQNLPVYNSGQYIYVMGLCNFFFFVSQDLIDRINSYFQRIAFLRHKFFLMKISSLHWNCTG